MNRFDDIKFSFKRLAPIHDLKKKELVSLETALKPVESIIDQLSIHVKTAKESCHYPSEHGLTRDESAAVYIYTMEWGDDSLYRILNNALRSENRQELEIWFSYLKLFDTGLNKLPTVKDSLWRGVSRDIGKDFVNDKTFTWWSINSCSLSVNVIKNFLGDEKNYTLFLIDAMSGKNTSGYTRYENEDEVILPAGSQFRVKAQPLKQPNGSYIVHIVQINDDNDETSKSATGGVTVTELPKLSKESTSIYFPHIPSDSQWTQSGTTIAGGNGPGDSTKQLYSPRRVYIDENQTIFVTDNINNRVVQWKSGENSGLVVAGGNGPGCRSDQLNAPTDVVFDKDTNSLIICDRDNRRVVRWSLEKGTTNGETLVSNIACRGLALDNQRYLYVSDADKHEVRRYQIGHTEGTLVAGGNGRGDRSDQLNLPLYTFVDDEYSVYVSDNENHRVMKWPKGATEGILVTKGGGKGKDITQLMGPNGLFVDSLHRIYVADWGNHRVIRWCEGAKRGELIVGGNGEGDGANQLRYPNGLSFDKHGNLYVVDCDNHRVQRFSIET